MTTWVPFLSEDAIERDAEALLAEFSSQCGVTLAPPIPIEDIVEKHLRLKLDFDDLHKLFNVPQSGPQPDIIGAIWFPDREVRIHECLDPDEFPGTEGRFRFTLAHEGGGHWRLHRQYHETDARQTSLFGDLAKPSVMCRSGQTRDRAEWQADLYASYLLMPKSMVMRAWSSQISSGRPQLVRRAHRIPLERVSGLDPQLSKTLAKFEAQRDDEALDHFARPFAEMFKVSASAMRIRLEKLGLLHRETPRQGSLAVTA